MAGITFVCGQSPCLHLLFPHLRDHALKLQASRYYALRRPLPTCLHYRGSRGRGRPIPKSFLQEINWDLHGRVSKDQISEARQRNNDKCKVAVIAVEVSNEHKVCETADQEAVLAGSLPSLQVQSPQEQEALAATPVHPEGLFALYASFFAGNLVEQVWHFAWPSAVALLHDSLLPVAVVSFVIKFVIFIGGAWIGAFMDSMPRVFAFNALSIVQTVAQVIAAGTIVFALTNGATSASTASALLVQPWFIILIVAAAVERLTGLASGVAFERDWVILLAGANRPLALAHANATLCRVDLLCEIAGTTLFGFLLSKFHPTTCLILAVAAMIGSLPVLILLVHFTNKVSKGVLDRPRRRSTHSNKSGKLIEAQSLDAPAEEGRLHMVILGWWQYLAQPALPASLAAVFLFFNVGLAPGSLMTSFLTQKGLNPSIIGAFSGMGACMGFVATFLSAGLIRRFGVLKAGALGLVFQALLLAVAVAVYWINSLSRPSSLMFFLALIVLARLGHFTYDIVGGQILQSSVPPSQANIVGTTEISLASLAELLMLSVAIVANDVSYFGSLAALSMAAVLGAACLYYWWMSTLNEELKRPL